MSRSFECTNESASNVEQFHRAFGDEKYWNARLAANEDGTSCLSALSVADDGTIAVETTMSLLHDRLPRMLTPLLPGDLELVHNETWRWVGDGGLHGEVRYVVPQMAASARGEVRLTPLRSGLRLVSTVKVTVRIPVVGGAIERFIGGQVQDGIAATSQFTTDWTERVAEGR